MMNILLKNNIFFMYKKHLYYFSLFVSCLLYMLLPSVSYGETYIYNDNVASGATWTKEGSPYLLQEPIYIPQDVSLQINAGVIVMSASTTDDMEPNSISANGNIHVYGTKEEPVRFIDLRAIYLTYNMSDIRFASFEKTGIDLWRATTTIENTYISHSEKGISARGSSVSISSTTFESIPIAVYSGEYTTGPFMSQVGSRLNAGGIGNALDTPIDPLQNSITIHDSSFDNITTYSLLNETVNTIDARDNWWGSNDGPNTGSIQGLAVVSPWKIQLESENVCCSSILFLPGIEASRLYVDIDRMFGTSTNTLWEPNRSKDIEKLFLNDNGTSLDPNIYTKDIIDSAFGVKNIYSKFIVTMNSLVSEGKIHEWIPYPYDWRKSIEDIVDTKLINQIYTLASSSKTHKVTIIAHSNGGLIAKALMKELERRGYQDSIDQIIFVAVPELGTPEALPALLHGYNQTLLGGMIMGKNMARNFSQNMPGAYGLLPSRKFFEKDNKPVITATGIRDAVSYEDMKKFLTENPWSATSSKDTTIPLLLRQSILSLVDKIHSSIDEWIPESSVKVSSLIGWGIPTSYSLSYHPDTHCAPSLQKQCPQEPRVHLSMGGDGAVLTKSSTDIASSKKFFNMKLFKETTGDSVRHADILEADAVLNVIQNQVSNALDSVSPQYKKYFSTEEPTSDDIMVTVQIFSPVDIHVYDKNGRHTGRAPNPIPGNEFDYVEDKAQGVTYVYGDNRIEQIAYYLDDGPYHIVLNGQAPGLFSALVEFHQHDEVIASTTFSDMPVTSLMTADFMIATSTENIATGTLMFIDADNDGVVDIINRSAEALKSKNNMNVISDMDAYLEYMRKTIITLKLPKVHERALLSRIDKIAKMNVKKYDRLIDKMGRKLKLKRLKKVEVTEAERKAVATLFEGLLTYIEQGGWEKDPRNTGN